MTDTAKHICRVGTARIDYRGGVGQRVLELRIAAAEFLSHRQHDRRKDQYQQVIEGVSQVEEQARAARRVHPLQRSSETVDDFGRWENADRENRRPGRSPRVTLHCH